MSKLVIVSLVASTVLMAIQAQAGVSESSAKEVEMEMTAEKEIVIKRAQGDAALFVFSSSNAERNAIVELSPSLREAMELVRQEKVAKGENPTALEVAIDIINRK